MGNGTEISQAYYQSRESSREKDDKADNFSLGVAWGTGCAWSWARISGKIEKP
jgi:hypothetical protein